MHRNERASPLAWIKYDASLHDKPRVQWIADHLGLDRYSVAGRLCAVWAWADTMTECGRIPFGTLGQVDRVAEMEGFGEAMQAVGWLEIDGTDLVVPEWETHHSASAKKRSQTAKRVSKTRMKPSKTPSCNALALQPCNAPSQARGEKRREEKNIAAVAREAHSIGIAPEGGGERLSGSALTRAVEAMVKTTGFPTPNGRDLEALLQVCGQIEDGAFPEVEDAARGDPLGYLRPRLARYWADRKAERDTGATISPPSLRKTLIEGRWRIDPDESTANLPEQRTPKHISPERARALDRLTRRNAS